MNDMRQIPLAPRPVGERLASLETDVINGKQEICRRLAKLEENHESLLNEFRAMRTEIGQRQAVARFLMHFIEVLKLAAAGVVGVAATYFLGRH